MKYKKGLFIIFVLIALGLSSWRGYQNWETRQTITEQEKNGKKIAKSS